MRQAYQYSGPVLVAVLAIYVITFHGFDAVTKQVTEELRFHEVGKPAPFAGTIVPPIGF
jgi:hypothetical protein